MGRTVGLLLLLLGLSGTFGKYVYVRQPKTWREAQKNCRQVYTDLAPISNDYDNRKLQEINKNIQERTWMGLRKLREDEWVWSGGTNVSKFIWRDGQPDNVKQAAGGILFGFLWNDYPEQQWFPSYCYRAIVVRQKKTWEDALDYCREHHADLASVASLTELLLIQKELRKQDATERVWLGLHFFEAEWLWVDRQPYSYRAWGPAGEPGCPRGLHVCAALQLEPADGSCDDKKSVRGCGAGREPERRGWRARHCEEELHFVCY